MNTAKFSFTILEYSGVWRPKSLTSQWAIKLYNFYSYIIFFVFVTILVSLFLYIILVRTNIQSLTENLMLFVGILALNLKVTYVLIQRNNIIYFDNMFLEIHCCPRDPDEFAIQKNSDSSNRQNTQRFLVACYIYFIMKFLFSVFFFKDGNISLPMKAWTPYSIESKWRFWLTYLQEMSVMTIMINAQVALDGLAIGMMQQISCQLEIIKHRLLYVNKINEIEKKSITPQAKFLKNCLNHHSHVYLIGQKLNNILGWLAFLMFLLTIVALCTVIYQFSVLNLNSIKFWSLSAAAGNYVFEIFLYCYYGQEMIEKSLSIADVAYEIDWTNLTTTSKKYLILIILRAAKPIELKGLSLVSMSLKTFLKILKVSYSTFNLIQSL